MSVFCTNSGSTYAGLSELIAGEAGAHSGEVVIELSGSNTGDVTFTAQDFDSVKIIAASGEEFDPTTSTGAIHTGKITATCPLIIDGTRVYDISVVYPTAQILNSEFGGAGNVGLTYGTSNNVYAYNCVIHDTYRGSYATGQNPNATLENCTLYNNSNLGLLRCNCINTVVIDCAGTDYFDSVSKVNTWGDDASAQNLVTDSYATLVDFANGDVRIRADSDAGLAGAGAFIEESASSGVDINASFSAPAAVMSASVLSEAPEVSLSASLTAPTPTLSVNVGHDAPEIDVNASLTSPSAIMSAVISGEAPTFTIDADFVSPSAVMATEVSDTPPTVSISAEFVAPINALDAHVAATIPGYDINVSMASPMPTLSAQVTSFTDDADLSAAFTAPMATLNVIMVNGDIIRVTPGINMIYAKPKSRTVYTKDKGRYL